MKLTATQLRKIIKEEVSKMLMEAEEPAQASGVLASLPGPVQNAIKQMRTPDKEGVAEKVARFIKDGKATPEWSEIKPQFQDVASAELPWMQKNDRLQAAAAEVKQYYPEWSADDYQSVLTAMAHAEPSGKPIGY